MMTPLPAARPSALTTMGGWKISTAFSSSVGGGADGVVAGGNVVTLQEALGEALAALQHGAASRVGPKTRRPCSCKASTMPRERGSSGPTMVRPGCSARATLTMASRSLRSTGTQRAIWAMPPLPGAQTTSVTRFAALYRPGQRVLAASGTEDQDFHALIIPPNGYGRQ